MTSEGTKLCLHTKMNGKRCQGIALTGSSYCRFHDRYYQRNCITSPDYDVPIFEDSRSIMLGIYELVQTRVKGKLDNRDLTSYMYAYQVASQLMNRPDAMAPDEAEPFEQAARQKALGQSAKQMQIKEEEPSDDRNLAEFLIDDLQQTIATSRTKEAAEQGLSAPQPMSMDRERTLRQVCDENPNLGEPFYNAFKGHYRRFPGNPCPGQEEAAEGQNAGCTDAQDE